MPKPVITVVGSFAVGLTIRTHHMPVFGETLIGSDFNIGPGGKGSNQAVGTARLGATAYFAGIIGQDKLGDIALELYAREGVHTDYLVQAAELATGAGFIILNQEGQNGIILDMSANQLMDTAFVDRLEDQIARSDVVTAVLEIPVEAAARAMELGKKHGVKTLLNPAPAQPLDPRIFQWVDYLTPNESELRILLGLAPDDPTPNAVLVRQLRACGAGTIILTQGESGALVFEEDEINHIPSTQVQVIDTTGAGDAFNAGLAVALAEGKPLNDAVRYANYSGALACTKLGVVPSLPYRPDVEHLQRQKILTPGYSPPE